MTADEITELFITAAEIDRRIPNTARPAQMKSMSLPFIHTFADMNGWGSERHDDERRDFWENVARRLNPNDVTLWERASDLIRLVENESQRRCLLHWSMAKAGGRPFSQWCRKVEHIHEETGRRRKDRAVVAIVAHDNCVTGQSKHELDFAALLPVGPEISDISVNIEESRREFKWAADGSRPLACDIDRDLHEFSWAEEQNARRRQREAKRRKEAA
jgi:hypothetical protein